MPRPSAAILLSTNVDDFFSIDILSADSLYAVVYKDRPINIKTKYWQANGEMKKYLRSSYSNKKTAENLAVKLNKYFMCNDFSVKEIL